MDDHLDPRIQVELENLNTATDNINKLEIELEEANSTFRILLNESTRRLKLLTKKLGSCIDKARPYYEALDKARTAQVECQKSAVQYQRANEIHAAAKETVALAEQRFMSNSHEWKFDNAWQEMLNHATIKVMEAENYKAEMHAEHQRRAVVFSSAEIKVQQLDEKYHRHIHKSRSYFESKQICQDQLETQKDRIQDLQTQIQRAKCAYSTALRQLEAISEEIHRARDSGNYRVPSGPREPGVGAELSIVSDAVPIVFPQLDYVAELDKCSRRSGACGSSTVTTSSAVSEKGDVSDNEDDNTSIDLDVLRNRMKALAVRPIEVGDGQQQEQNVWETELNATVDKLDQLMIMREKQMVVQSPLSSNGCLPSTITPPPSLPPVKLSPEVRVSNADQNSIVNLSLRELPITSPLHLAQERCTQRLRKLSLQ